MLERCGSADSLNLGDQPICSQIPNRDRRIRCEDLFLLHCWWSQAPAKRARKMPPPVKRSSAPASCAIRSARTRRTRVGPVLNGVIGRKAGSVAGYSYSDANKNSGITWDEATFREYIKDPKAKVPGTKMAYAGLKDEQKINDLVAFLKQFDADGKKK